VPETPVEEETESSSNSVIFAPIDNSLERFQQECAANLMECLLAADLNESAEHLAKVLNSLPAGEIFLQDSPMLRRLVEFAKLGRALRWSSQGGPNEASQATITLAEALIAQTGSVFVTASCGGRGASVVAPCHIVFATIDQLVPDLQTALANAGRERKLDSNSFACVIQPHRRYRKDLGARCARTETAGGDSAELTVTTFCLPSKRPRGRSLRDQPQGS
jgi:L-lactate dehydrogenase complex protein LldG